MLCNAAAFGAAARTPGRERGGPREAGQWSSAVEQAEHVAAGAAGE